MEKQDVIITVDNSPKMVTQTNNKEIRDPKINLNYDKAYNTASIPSDNNIIGYSANTKSNINNVEFQESMDSIYLNIKNRFMIKVFGILSFQLIFTFAFVLICQKQNVKEFLLSQNILGICLICIAAFVYLVTFIVFLCKPDLMKRVPANYIILFVITICFTIILVYLTIYYRPEIVVAAITFLIAISLAMFAISLFNKIEVGFMSIALIGLLFLAINYGILAAVYRNYYLYFLYVSIVGIIYALFIAYDTTFIRDNFDIDDYAFGALTLYFDIIRLFILLLKIFGGGKN